MTNDPNWFDIEEIEVDSHAISATKPIKVRAEPVDRVKLSLPQFLEHTVLCPICDQWYHGSLLKTGETDVRPYFFIKCPEGHSLFDYYPMGGDKRIKVKEGVYDPTRDLVEKARRDAGVE